MADALRTWVEAAPLGKRDLILHAALERFAHYGFRRTSMGDIAQQAGISRAALYLHFRNKEEIFRALGRELHERAMAAAEEAAGAASGLAAQLEAALTAKVAMFEVVHAAAHARELLDENSRLCGEVSAEFRTRHLKLLSGLLAAATRRREVDPKRAGLTAAGAAEILLDGAKGMETAGGAVLGPGDYRRRLRQLVRVVVLALGAR